MSTFVEKVALDLLRRDGIKVIWNLHVAAAQAAQFGLIETADQLLQIADAAEEFCLSSTESGASHYGSALQLWFSAGLSVASWSQRFLPYR
jgi:hypothetical protein